MTAQRNANVNVQCEGKSPRILVVRLSAIGDCVLTVPLVHALRDLYPNAHLGWIVDERAAPLLDGLAGLDELLVIPRRWHRSASSILLIRRALKQRAFDMAIDPQSLTKSGLLSFLSGAPQRLCFAAPVGREFGPWFGNVRIRPTKEHVVDRTLEMIGLLGCQIPRNVRFDLPLYPGTDAILEFVRVAIGREAKCGVINVGAGWPSKLWSACRFAAVARFLGTQLGISSVVVWHGEERDMAVDVVAQSGGHAHLAPVTNLRDLATLCRKSEIFIGSDTGPLHLAAAVGTPCVGLYGPTAPGRCGPYGDAHRVVQPDHGVRLVRMRKGSENFWMQKIGVDQVIAACQDLLQQTRHVTACDLECGPAKRLQAGCAASAERIGHLGISARDAT